MTDGTRNEPAWYRADVEPAPPAGLPTADDAERPNRGAMALAAFFIVVIIGSIGVSVSALRGDGRTGTTETGTARSTDPTTDEGPGQDEATSSSTTVAPADEGEPAATPSTTSTAAPKKRPTTVATERPRDEPRPEPTTTAPHPSSTTATEDDDADEEETTGPTVTSVWAPETFVCSSAPEYEGMGWLTLSWSSAHAESVTVSIDHFSGAYQTDLPTSGELEVPAPCSGETNVYYVTAVGPDGATDTMSATTTGL